MEEGPDGYPVPLPFFAYGQLRSPLSGRRFQNPFDQSTSTLFPAWPFLRKPSSWEYSR